MYSFGVLRLMLSESMQVGAGIGAIYFMSVVVCGPH